MAYLAGWNPLGLGDPDVRRENPLLLAIRADDYAFWMAAASSMRDAFSPEKDQA